MADEEEAVELHEGMKVSNEDGEALGILSAMLVEDEDEDAEFFLLKTATGEHLIPFEAVLGVGDGELVVDATAEAIAQYPSIKPGTEPTDADIERAYDVYDETAQYADDADE